MITHPCRAHPPLSVDHDLLINEYWRRRRDTVLQHYSVNSINYDTDVSITPIGC